MMESLIKSIASGLGLLSKEQETFAVKPYLQLAQSANKLALIWFSARGRSHWAAQYRTGCDTPWISVKFKVDKDRKIEINNCVVRKFSLFLPLEAAPKHPEYQILFDGQAVFASHYQTPGISAEDKIVVFGDFGDGKNAASAVSAAVHAQEPELIVLAGDLVYDHGRISEYLSNFFPVLNADAIHKNIGAPILRSIVTVAAAGNHDIGMPKQNEAADANLFADLFGYFLFWQGSGNGPRLKKETIKNMIGTKKKANQLLSDYGKSFIRQTNYSFDWKDQHWIVLDANKYLDWSVPELQDWLAQDLKMAASQKWKFVVFHQPGFNSDRKYFIEQRMRLICPILEAGGVDIVFNGHCHFYERHRPLFFKPDHLKPMPDGTVSGQFVIDYQFDGVNNTRPHGVLYVVTGAGGKLVSSETKPNADFLCLSSAVLIDTVHSFTELTFAENYLRLNQIGLDGTVLDSIKLEK